jgi:oligoendopeptidase F
LKYKAMLSATPCCTIEEAGAMMGIDLTKKDFWRTGLSEIAEEIEQFCAM